MAVHNATMDATAASARAARWKRVGTAAVLILLAIVAVMLVRYARAVDWEQVGAALASYEAATLAVAGALALLSYALYSGYDLLARRYAGHGLATRRVVAIAAMSYAFNLNLGTIIGGAGIRYRLYSQAGLAPGAISRILGFAIATNWIGYVAVAGAVFTLHAIDVPPHWAIGADGFRILGPALLLAAAGYVFACGSARGRTWSVRGHDIHLPSRDMALLQISIAAANWLAISTIMFVLLRGQIALPEVMATMLLAAIAGVLTRVPAGLGVLELVVLTLLGGELGEPELLAALLAYRAIYYIAPLLLALLGYARFEAIAGVRAGR